MRCRERNRRGLPHRVRELPSAWPGNDFKGFGHCRVEQRSEEEGENEMKEWTIAITLFLLGGSCFLRALHVDAEGNGKILRRTKECGCSWVVDKEALKTTIIYTLYALWFVGLCLWELS